PAPTGYVKLSDVATVTQTLGPTQITHIGGQRTATVSATATSNNVGGVTKAIQTQLNALHLPSGVTVTMGGVSQMQSQAFGRLALRPILTTALGTILALIPIARDLSKDGAFIAALLATTVIGRLPPSPLLTLLLVPTLYVRVEGGRDRKNPANGNMKPVEDQE